MWGYIGAIIGGILLGLLINYISPPFNHFMDRCFSWLFHLVNPDRFDLTGSWTHSFSEPTTNDPSQWQDVKEKVKLQHIGNRVKGEGKTDVARRDFSYRCTVSHNMVFGSYVKEGEKGNMSGSGMIQLIVSPDRVRMQGHATWYDNDTKQIESSKSTWEKVS